MSNLDLSMADLTCMRDADGVLPNGCQDQIIELTPNYITLSLVIVALLAVVLLVAFSIRKLKLMSIAKSNSRTITAAFTGWAIWCFVVFSYAKMFDEHVDYFVWFTLPPICFFLVILWWRVFFKPKL